MRIFSYCLYLFMLLSACNGNDETAVLYKLDTTSANTKHYIHSSPNTAAIDFLKWYRDNEERLRAYYPVSGGLPESASNYYIDFPVAEKYLSELKGSGYLSDAFINDMMDYFKLCSLYLKKHPVNDGPPPGFEADLIMKSQDYGDVWSGLDHAKTAEKIILQNKAMVDLLYSEHYHQKFYLSKQNSRWLIDSIDESFKTSASHYLRLHL